jgi:hypothetical protein
MIKYYFRLDSINENKPLALYYVNYSNYSEKRFDKVSGKWVPTDRVYFAIISGDMDYEQVDVEDAKKFAPEAFKGSGK